MKSVYPDRFKILHRILQDGCNLDSDEYPITVESSYVLLGLHSSQVVSSHSRRRNGGCVSRFVCVHNCTCAMFTYKLEPLNKNCDSPAPVAVNNAQTNSDIMCYNCNKSVHVAYSFPYPDRQTQGVNGVNPIKMGTVLKYPYNSYTIPLT